MLLLATLIELDVIINELVHVFDDALAHLQVAMPFSALHHLPDDLSDELVEEGLLRLEEAANETLVHMRLHQLHDGSFELRTLASV